MSEPTSILLIGGSGAEAARLRRSLARHFLLVEFAEDFDAARELATRCLFHVAVLVDPQLPWARLQAACADCDGLPATILLIAPQGRTDSAIAALRGGAADVLLRPFSTDELVTTVRALARGAANPNGNDAPESGTMRDAAPPDYPEDWTLEKVKNHHMTRVLEACGGNKSRAARRLGVSRKTLERRLGTGETKRRRSP